MTNMQKLDLATEQELVKELEVIKAVARYNESLDEQVGGGQL